MKGSERDYVVIRVKYDCWRDQPISSKTQGYYKGHGTRHLFQTAR
jgi:hypothetical protein